MAGLHQAKQGLVFGMKLAGGSVFFPSTLFLVLTLTSVVSEMDTSQAARYGPAREAQPGRLTHTLTISHPSHAFLPMQSYFVAPSSLTQTHCFCHTLPTSFRCCT